MKKKFCISIFCLWFLALNVQCAYATTVAVNPFANTMTGVLNANILSRGFTLADPRVYATLRAVGGVLARWAASAAYGAFAGTAWGAGLVGALYLAKEGGEAAAKWLWDYNNPKNVTVTTPVTSPNTPPIVPGGAFYSAYSGGKFVVGGNDPQAVGAQFASMMGSNYRLRDPCTGGPTSYQCTAYEWDPVNKKWASQSSFSVSGGPTASTNTCGSGYFVDSTGACHKYDAVLTGTNGLPVTLSTAVAGIPGLDMSKPLNPAITAGIANKAWIDAASQPGYAGIPYDYTRPITVADVDNWVAGNTSFAPTVDNFTRPLTGTNPFDLPLTGTPVGTIDNTQVNTGTNAAASQPATNLGSDPGIGAPQLEDTPTAKMILDPILNMLPDFKNYTVAPIAGECPKPSFQAFDTTIKLDKHCDLLEQNRALLRATMMIVFALGSLFIVLRA